MFRKLFLIFTVGLFANINGVANAFSVGEHYVCGFDNILRFYDYREPYLTDSFSNQSPISFVIEKGKVKTGENWFVGSQLQIKSIGDSYLTAFNGTDLIKIRKQDGRIFGYAGTLDSYIKLFYVQCRQL